MLYSEIPTPNCAAFVESVSKRIGFNEHICLRKIVVDYQIIKPDCRSINKWAGGTTEELMIYPMGAQYCNRDFAFRVSTAVVDLEQTDFTLLPAFTRWISILKGHIKLIHEGYGQVSLNPLEAYCFDGGWTTRSIGKCTDFNLMLGKGWNGYITLTPEHCVCGEAEITGIFAFDGPLMLELGSPATTRIALMHRDMVVVNTQCGNTQCGITVVDGAHARSVLFKAWESP